MDASSAEFPPYPPCRGTDKDGFAFPTLAKRLPVILTKAVDAVCRVYLAPGYSDAAHAKDGKKVVEELGRLRHELTRDRALEVIRDSEEDAEEWNRVIASRAKEAWFSAPWLFSECYAYRRVRETLVLNNWADFDPFAESKRIAFKDSKAAVAELSSRFSVIRSFSSESGERLAFHELLQICLWGNATDLSLLPHLSAEMAAELQSRASSMLSESEKNILSNDIDSAWDHVKGLNGGRCDVILDNAGFELFGDLLFADYLHSSGRVKNTVFHGKRIPWFVSDVTPADFDALFEQLLDPAFFGFKGDAQKAVETLVARWKGYLDSGAWKLTTHAFWTLPHPYPQINERAPELYATLKESGLVLFKGDLNYRKLLSDAHWPATTPFAEAIGKAWQGIPVLALRTNKSDPIVGLAEGVAEKLQSTEEDWRWSGKYGVVEFAK